MVGVTDVRVGLRQFKEPSISMRYGDCVGSRGSLDALVKRQTFVHARNRKLMSLMILNSPYSVSLEFSVEHNAPSTLIEHRWG
jgi:hypothetical protein